MGIITIPTDYVEWVEYERVIVIKSLEDMPKNAIGFIYEIDYTDGTRYIGKKNLYNTKTIKAKKTGDAREHTVKRIYKNTGKGYRQAYDMVRIESDWLTYNGSSELTKNKVIERKWILAYAYNLLELTYLEAKYLFQNDVLENDTYVNDNILGKFFSSNLRELIERNKQSLS